MFVSVFHEFVIRCSLMRAVAGVGSTEAFNPRLASKQTAYIGLVVGLMCQCSQNREVRAEQFKTPLHGLLYDITLISSSGMLELGRMMEGKG